MKKTLFLLLLVSSISYGQTIAPTKVKITANTLSESAPYVNVQEADGYVNKINKVDLVDVIEAASASELPITGTVSKIYVTKDNNKIYRWNGTFYQELSALDISGKVDKNAPITAGTKTKITYDAKGLVTAGTDLVASDIPNIEQSQVNGLSTDLATKVDKVSGKQLSTEDYTTAEKNKLAGIAVGATVNSTDAQLRDRATHTGTQAISTVMGLQAAIDAKINLTLIGANNGITPLDAGGKVPFAYLPASLMIYKGMWNPATNTPTLADNTGVAGWVYKANASGTIDLGSGNIVVVVNDFIIHNGTKWEWSSGTDDVVSVNGQQGVVSLNTSHIPEVANKRYQTDAQNTNNNASSPIQGQLDGKEPTISPKLTAFNKNFGTTAGTVAEGNDSRFTDARNPLPNSANYIQNQNSSAQSANMWINGFIKSSALEINSVFGEYIPLKIFGNLNLGSKDYASILIGNSESNNQSAQFGWVFDNITPSQSFAHITPYGLAEGSIFKLFLNGAATFSNTISALGGNSTNWNTAFSWGNHASAGYAPLNNPTFTGSVKVPTATLATEAVNKGQLDAATRPYKVYTALLSQSGTNAPVDTVLENTLGGTVVWSRDVAGQYTGTLSGAFTSNKSTIDISAGVVSYTYSRSVEIIDTNQVRISTFQGGSGTDGLMGNTYTTIEIRVYN